MSDSPKYGIEATTTSLTILELLVDRGEPMGVTALADHLDVGKSVVHNHLSTLHALGYVVKQESMYRPSLRTLALGTRTRDESTIYRHAKHHLDNLTALSNETTVLFGLEETQGVPIYISETEGSWTPVFREGERQPLHANAAGKALLSSLPDDRVDRILATEALPSLTESTVTDPDELRRQIDQIRDDSIVFSREEQWPGVVSVAAPVRTGTDGTVAAVSICGSADRLNRRYLEEDIAGQVLSTAKSIRIDRSDGDSAK